MKKRIALAAVAALAGGLLVAAPASAAVDAFTSTSASTGVVGGYASVGFGVDTTTANVSYTVFVSTGSIGSVSGDTTTVTAVGGGVQSYPATSLQFAPDAGGSASGYVETLTVTAPAGPQTITVNKLVNGTVSAQYTKALTWSAFSATSYVTASAVATNQAVDGNVYASATAGTAATTISVTEYGNTGAALTSGSNSIAPAYSFSLAGVGTLTSYSAGGSVSYVAGAAATNATPSVAVLADGRSGTGVVSVSVNGVVIKTVTIKFYGAIATLTATQSKFIVSTSGVTATAGTTTAEGVNAVQLVATDANGVKVPLTSATATSSNPLVIFGSNGVVSSYNAGAFNEGLSIAAVATSGQSASVTYSVVNSSLVTISSAPVTFTVGGGVASVTAAFDTATYAPGAKAVLTLTAKDSSGNAVADGSAAVAANGLASNLAAQGLANAAVSYSKGVASVTLYAPANSGAWTVSYTEPTLLTTISASATVSAPADAASASAAAAAKATSDAIAALQTSIGSLTTTVAALVASMTAQIKVINATLRIQSKALAKIKKKLGIK